MSDQIVTLDSCHYRLEDNGTCILSGWMYTEGEPQVQVRAGHVPVECTMTRWARPDALAARPDLPFPDENAGFEIRIRNMEQIFSIADSLRARIFCDGQSFPLIQKTMKQVIKEYYEDTINYYMECVERRLDKVYLQGWCINVLGDLKMEVMDDSGRVIPEAHWGSIRRPDLAEAYSVKLEQCHGFLVEIPRDKIRSKTIRLVFSNHAAKREFSIDMRRFDRDNSRVSRIMKTLGRENKEKNRQIIKELGMRGFLDYLQEESCSFTDAYGFYAKKHQPGAKELRRQAKTVFSPAPLFSIVVPLYHTPENFLKDLIDSVTAQSYQNWELCLADGSKDNGLEQYISRAYPGEHRIHYRHLAENTGIAGNTNGAIAMADGDYIVFADHDDTLAPDALYEMACVFRDHPETELAYSDEDLMDEKGNYVYPHFKSDFNLENLRCNNYICHLVAVKKSLLEKTGLLRSEFDGAQDHDFLLRCAEATKEIRHVPKVLYHWRSHDGSTAGNQDSKQYAIDAGKKALQEHFRRMGLEAEVEFSGIFIIYRIKYKVKGNPKVSILIPNKDHIEDLEKCVVSIEEKSTWKNIEIIVIENNSEQQETFDYYEKLQQRFSNVKTVRYEGSFNYSAINNFGASFATGDYYLLLNNDTEVITGDWLEQMVGFCQRDYVAITGAKLYYPDNTVQHAGVVVGMGGFAGHILTGYGKNYVGYLGRLQTAQEVSAVTGACLMVRADIFKELNGLDEGFGVALNDVDFCLRARALDKKVIFAPGVELYHYESKSRGLEITPEKQARFQKEISRFQERYKELLEEGDPYYNPNLSLVRGDCSLRKAHELVKGR